jgi:AraC-like DNA-binding protein
MEPSYRLIQPQANRSFVFKLEPFGLTTRWHYHPEIELIYFMEGKTSAVIGEGFQEFEEGDLVLLGANFPHVLQESKEFIRQHPEIAPFGLIVQFTDTFLGNDFILKPELKPIQTLLSKAKRGLKFHKTSIEKVSESLHKMHYLNDTRKLISLLDVLTELAETAEFDYLTPKDYFYDHTQDEERMVRVNEYVYKHFADTITIADVAKVANMTESSFCRYFKSRTLKHFTRFLNEVRVSHACKVLRNGQSVTDAFFESGFNNQSYFNQQFKKIQKMTPMDYQKWKLKGVNPVKPKEAPISSNTPSL